MLIAEITVTGKWEGMCQNPAKACGSSFSWAKVSGDVRHTVLCNSAIGCTKVGVIDPTNRIW